MGIFSSIGHFLFGGKAKSNSNTTSNSTQTATNDPYAETKPYITDYLSSANNVFNNTPQISALEQSGYDSLARSSAGNEASLSAAQQANDATISGKYLTADTNPYLADIAKRVGASALQTVNSTFGGKGRTGSGLHALYAGQGVGNALTDLYGQEYGRERQLQSHAIDAATGLASGQTANSATLVNGGAAVSARPFDINAQYGNVLSQIAKLGGTATGTSTGATTGSSTGQAESSGVIGNMVKKLFA